jgi:peptidoglycan hydrolase FlgJ
MSINAARITGSSFGSGAPDLKQIELRRSAAQSSQSLAPSHANQPGSPELKAAFNDFVGQTFFGQLLKQMRQTVGKPAFVHGGMGEDIFQSQLDQILVERMSDASAATFSDPMYQLLMARRP